MYRPGTGSTVPADEKCTVLTRERECCIDNEEGVLCWQWRGSIVLTRERKYCVRNGEGAFVGKGEGVLYWQWRGSTV